jgi:hypothetical protein
MVGKLETGFEIESRSRVQYKENDFKPKQLLKLCLQDKKDELGKYHFVHR